MNNVSDLLKSEAFIKNQLYPFLISKFKEGTIPTDRSEFLNCCSFDKEHCALKFCYKFGALESEAVQILLGTSGTFLEDWTVCHLLDNRDIYTFSFDYLKVVIQQTDCIDRINRLISIAGTTIMPKVIASVMWDGGIQKNRINTKYSELCKISQERISQLENQEIKEQEKNIF